jgi:GNAT superfamily N-acetyltransferase
VSIDIRRGDRLDIPFMRSLLGHAYNWHVAAFDTDISISRYVDGWGRKGDTVLIATDGGHPVGAAWYRLFPDGSPGYGTIDDHTPELTVVVVPTRQGQGIGLQLLSVLLYRAKDEGYEAVSVSVRRGDHDMDEFVQQGFVQIAEDGDSLTLRRALA